MEFFQSLGDKLEVHATRISLLGVTFKQADRAAKQLDWRQYHVNKTGGDTVDASFIASKEETLRVWKLLNGDTPDPLLA